MLPLDSSTTGRNRSRRRSRCSPNTATRQGPGRGQSLIPLLKLRFAAPGHVIDISRIPGLERGGRRATPIGAVARHRDLERSDLSGPATRSWPPRRRRSPTPSSATSGHRRLARTPTRRATGARSCSPCRRRGVQRERRAELAIAEFLEERSRPRSSRTRSSPRSGSRSRPARPEVRTSRWSARSATSRRSPRPSTSRWRTARSSAPASASQRSAPRTSRRRRRRRACRGGAHRGGVRRGRAAGRRGLLARHRRPRYRRVQAAHRRGVRSAWPGPGARDGSRGLGRRGTMEITVKVNGADALPTSSRGCSSFT